jgi:hypothetical protein
MRIFSGGNVFIGSSPSNAGFKLDVNGTGRFNGNIILAPDGTYGSSYITLGLGGTSNGSNRIFAGTSSSVDGIFIAAATGRPISFRAGGGTTDHLTIASTGVATFLSNQNSTSTYTIQNTDSTNTSSRLRLDLVGGNSALSFVSIHNDHNYISSVSGKDLYFQQTFGGTTNMTIKSGGNVLIGTTTDAGQKFQVSGTGLITGETTFGNAAAGTNLIVNINGVTNKAGRIQFMESGSVKWLIGNGAASENGRFEVFDNVNGTGVQLLRGATAWTSLSDERFKDIIEPISVNNKLKNIRSVIGKYKTDKEGIRRNFLIAQDLLEVFPEVVDVDENEEKPMGVRYQDLIPILVSALQELKQEIDTLKK